MKSTLERLGPTKVTLSVEVPFEELTPAVNAAYQRIARQVKVQGFRPGKVPPRILDQRVGRGTVLQEALQDAIPRCYASAVEQEQLPVLGHPEIDVASFADGAPLVFTATVEVRPEVTLPAYDGLPVTVDDLEITDVEIDEQLTGLQDRFAVLSGVDRPVQDGDYVSLDINATVDGEPLEGAQASGLSYEVGSGGLVEGLDAAIRGAVAGEQRRFDDEIRYGDAAGRTASFEVTVKTVKEKSVPALDDDFAQSASEFDTIDELRADVRGRLERVKRVDQGLQARDRALEALLSRVELPLPESLVEEETQYRARQLEEQAAQAGTSVEEWMTATGQDREQLDRDLRAAAEHAVKATLVLDALAAREQVQVSEAELTQQVVRRAQRAGLEPNELARRLVESGRLPALMEELGRGKALALVLEAAVVTDASGGPVDLAALRVEAAAPSANTAPVEA